LHGKKSLFMVNPMKPIHFLMIIVPSLFLLTIGVVTYAAYHRTSGITGLDAAKMQQMRVSR
jgi:hypothetical protein